VHGGRRVAAGPDPAADLATAGAIYLRERPIHLVILDHALRDGWGLDCCRRVKREPDAPPIVIVTALTQAMDELRGCGDEVIGKPFDPEGLTSGAARLLGARSAGGG
jgi:DNA-binding response OmpR family regulator